MINFEADEATSKIVDGAPAVRRRLTEIELEKRKSKPTERWLAYWKSHSEERRKKMDTTVLRKSSAVDEFLYPVRNVEAVRGRCSRLMEYSKYSRGA